MRSWNCGQTDLRGVGKQTSVHNCSPFWHIFLQQFVPVSASPGHSSFTVVAKLISNCFIILSAEVWYTPAGPVHFIQKASSDSFLWNSGIAGEDKMNNEKKPCWKHQLWEKKVRMEDISPNPTDKKLLFAGSPWAITFMSMTRCSPQVCNMFFLFPMVMWKNLLLIQFLALMSLPFK